MALSKMRIPMHGQATFAGDPCACWWAFRRPAVPISQVEDQGPQAETTCLHRIQRDGYSRLRRRAGFEKARRLYMGRNLATANVGMRPRVHTARPCALHPRADTDW